ncbi:energy-coupling factor transporter transmembrane component T [Candidatus Enterococcus ferrettii]|uniref:Energy-coupling factor transport system permease n=1 Tax=Candidatus Enterococcus ferrettii TaxID=2815324 RepID=A0ABV0ER12_9ENTE|nr:energy-coupling factor transporter transmembrane component T [Enterococcus sp. 665A]MBO1342902.1 energy-coupling factor transporter transmembrane protein EcfT [Enterococcus sp. 665A]
MLLTANKQILSNKKQLYLDPRTKLLLLFTVTIFVLGNVSIKQGLSGRILTTITPCLSLMPFLLLVSAKKYKTTLTYFFLYVGMTFTSYFFSQRLTGLPNFLLLAATGLLTRFLPSILMGIYVVSTTTVSEFIAGFEHLHVSNYLVIPLSVMLRFFPTVIEEFKSINQAMRMRGISFKGTGKLSFLEYRMVPLMTCSAKIGEDLSVSALTRGLSPLVKRTNICKIGFRIQDCVAILFCLFAFSCLFLNKFGVL